MGDPSKTEPSPSLQLRIDEPCLHFEQRWQTGDKPSIEAFLAKAAEADREALLEELLLLEWTYRRQRGEAVALDESAGRFTASADAVRRAWQRWTGTDTGADAKAELDTTAPDAGASGAGEAAAPAGYQDAVVVGRGGMGVVYRAYDPRLKRAVALKRVLPERVTTERLRRFRTEAEAVGRLGHPHVVQVYALEETAEGPMLVMEYVPGGSLEAWLRGRSLAAAEAARLVSILARAVQAAHDAGVVHRDLKPDNVLLAPGVAGNSGTVAGVFPKLTDFGLSMLAGDERHTQQGVVFGTPAYLPPEQASGDVSALGPKADVWSLGVILYRCLSGRLPFRGACVLETLDLIRKRPAPPLGLAGEEALERLCLRCLDKDPARRSSAGELADELDRLASGSGSPPAPRRRRAWAVAAGLVGALALAAVLGWRLWPPHGEVGLRGDDAAEEEKKEVVAPADVKPAMALTVLSLKATRHPRLEKDQDEPREQGEIGKQTYSARFDDVVRVEAEFSEEACAFLIAFTPDGKQTLLWPVDGKGEADARRAPPRARVVRHHATDEFRGFGLDENPKGGTQAFVVVASRSALPAFEEWSKGWKERWWRVLRARGVVWRSNGDWLETKAPGKSADRSKGVALPDQPLLVPLCRGLKAAGVEVVEGIAFGVRAKEDEP